MEYNLKQSVVKKFNKYFKEREFPEPLECFEEAVRGSLLSEQELFYHVVRLLDPDYMLYKGIAYSKGKKNCYYISSDLTDFWYKISMDRS